MKQLVQIAFVALVLSGCSSGDFKTDNGLTYRFVNEHPDHKTGNIEDIYLVNMMATTEDGDTILSESLMFERYHPRMRGDFQDALARLHEGDSAIFKLNADSFFEYHPGTLDLRTAEQRMNPTIDMHIGVTSILSPLDHFVYMSEQELVRMNEFVARKRWDVKTDSTGIMYEITIHKPENQHVLMGDTVKLTYLYYTLGEKIIARSKDGDFWRMEVGDPALRVSGLSRILTFMREGERIRAILPFAEAFGEDGMPPLVPPYTPVVMEITVEELN
ncbi:MAG: FKBP-type peptidyl-prolyl cis-trans isomerase [Flavobacteriales bacterium]|nr:FKBP-type peptidyl-prolyl cis-trans isomerase [Flavobacteriales bacterium]